MKYMDFNKWGFRIMNLSITWYDLWESKFVFEIALWRNGNPYWSTNKLN